MTDDHPDPGVGLLFNFVGKMNFPAKKVADSADLAAAGGPFLVHRNPGDRFGLCQMFFGAVHPADHSLITLLRAIAEGEDPVFEQQQPLHLGVLLKYPGGEFGQGETRHDIRHNGETSG